MIRDATGDTADPRFNMIRNSAGARSTFGQTLRVGMFDWYEPTVGAICPSCGQPIIEWQGKSGPCALFVWRQGERHPVGQPIAEESKIEPARYSEFSLPTTFDIWGYCAEQHGWTRECQCTDGVWRNTGPLHPMREPNVGWR